MKELIYLLNAINSADRLLLSLLFCVQSLKKVYHPTVLFRISNSLNRNYCKVPAAIIRTVCVGRDL